MLGCAQVISCQGIWHFGSEPGSRSAGAAFRFRVGPSGRAEPLVALTAQGQSWRRGYRPPAGLQLAPRACLSSFLVINPYVVTEQQEIWVFLRLNPAYGRSSLCSVVGLRKRVLGVTWRTVLVCKDPGQQAPSDRAETDHDNGTVY